MRRVTSGKVFTAAQVARRLLRVSSAHFGESARTHSGGKLASLIYLFIHLLFPRPLAAQAFPHGWLRAAMIH